MWERLFFRYVHAVSIFSRRLRRLAQLFQKKLKTSDGRLCVEHVNIGRQLIFIYLGDISATPQKTLLAEMRPCSKGEWHMSEGFGVFGGTDMSVIAFQYLLNVKQ